MKQLKKGFTLIELLVVIAIIGILASVVLASLNSARNKGKDANAKATISSMRAQAEIYYDNNGLKYYVDASNNMCTDTQIADMITAAEKQIPDVTCTADDSGGSYTVIGDLNIGTDFCVDSTGFAGDKDAGYTAGTKCK